MGLKTGGEILHSGTPTAATTSATGADPGPRFSPNGRCTPAGPRASERAPPRPHPFLRAAANQESGRAGAPPLHAALGS